MFKKNARLVETEQFIYETPRVAKDYVLTLHVAMIGKRVKSQQAFHEKIIENRV